LVEQEFITHNGSTIEHSGKTVNKGYFMHMLAKDYVSESVFTNESASAEVSIVDEIESLQDTKLIESSNEDQITEVVTLNNERTSNTLEQKHLEEIDLAESSCEQIAEVVGLQQEKISIDDKEVRTNIDDGNRLYLRATKLFEEGWLAEASEDEDASLIAKSRFADAIQLYAEAMNLDPFNIVYRQAFNITSLKIDGNSFFNEGVELADLAYQLEEELLSEEKGNIEDYDVIINKYRDVIRIYQVAHDKFAEGLILSQDIRFESCMELVNQSIKNIQEAIDQLESEKLDIEILVDVTEYDTEELGLVSKKPVIRMDGPYIELFANSNEHGASESVLIGSNYTPDYYLSM
jgi:tetratricopeptide (TPR) repeat protein